MDSSSPDNGSQDSRKEQHDWEYEKTDVLVEKAPESNTQDKDKPEHKIKHRLIDDDSGAAYYSFEVEDDDETYSILYSAVAVRNIFEKEREITDVE